MGKSAVFSFGRFNPPTRGHAVLFQNMVTAAMQYKVDDIFVGISQSVDPVKNPLLPSDRESILKKLPIFKNIKVINQTKVINAFALLEFLAAAGYDHLVFMVGEDRQEVYSRMIEWSKTKFPKVNLVALPSDPGRFQVGGQDISGTRLREAAARNDFKTFQQGFPKEYPPAQVVAVYRLLRQRMNLSVTEEVHYFGGTAYPTAKSEVRLFDGSRGIVESLTGKKFQVRITRDGFIYHKSQQAIVESVEDSKQEETVTGILRQTKEGFVYVDVPDEIIHGFYQMIKAAPTNAGNIQKPDYFPQKEDEPGKVGAHITVIRKSEARDNNIQLGPLEGKPVKLTVDKLYSVKPEGWPEMARVWFLSMQSPELEKIREKLGLSPKVNGDHDFHITVAVKPKTAVLFETLADYEEEKKSVAKKIQNRGDFVKSPLNVDRALTALKNHQGVWFHPSKNLMILNPKSLDHTAAIPMHPDWFEMQEADVKNFFRGTSTDNFIWNDLLMEAVMKKGWVRIHAMPEDGRLNLHGYDLKDVHKAMVLCDKMATVWEEVYVDYGPVSASISGAFNFLLASGSQILAFIRTGREPSKSLVQQFREDLR